MWNRKKTEPSLTQSSKGVPQTLSYTTHSPPFFETSQEIAQAQFFSNRLFPFDYH